MTKTTFEEAVAFLNERGIEFRQGQEYVGPVPRRPEPRAWIEGLAPPFSAEEWLDIVSADSELFGSCCANISAARDILYSKVRHGRWLDSKDLWEFIEILKNHDGFEYMLSPTDKNYAEWSSWEEGRKPQDDPIYRLWEVYDKIKDHLKLAPPYVVPFSDDAPIREPIRAAISVLHAGVGSLYWSTSCFGERDGDPQWVVDQRRAERQLTIARLMPALRDVMTHIDKLDLGDFDGFAICKQAEPDAVCDNRLGLCIYSTMKDAQEMIERWCKVEDEEEEARPGKKPTREQTVIRPVHVSSKTGLTFKDKTA